MNLRRSAETHGEPQHPLPCLDQACWRRFLEPADLYVIMTDEGVGSDDAKEMMVRSLHALETVSGTLTDDPDEVHGGIVVGTDEKFAIVYESSSIGPSTTITMNAIIGDHHHSLEFHVPAEHGAWSIMPSDDGTASLHEMRTALRRFHRVLCYHLRMAILQAVDEAGPRDEFRRKAIVATHMMPILSKQEDTPKSIDLATPWGGAIPMGVNDQDAADAIAREISSLPLLDGTRLAVRVNHMPADAQRGPITSIDMAPVRETIGEEPLEIVECLRQMSKLRKIGPLRCRT